MKPPKCRLCESAHWSHEPHKFAINTAINTDDIAINTAINRVVVGTRIQKHVEAVSPPSNSDGPSSGDALTPNRRKRDAYNTYMREYMRKRRGLA